jgi:hypothetical protein
MPVFCTCRTSGSFIKILSVVISKYTLKNASSERFYRGWHKTDGIFPSLGASSTPVILRFHKQPGSALRRG